MPENVVNIIISRQICLSINGSAFIRHGDMDNQLQIWVDQKMMHLIRRMND